MGQPHSAIPEEQEAGCVVFPAGVLLVRAAATSA